MISAQQQQTLAYFEAHAAEWHARANAASERKLNTLQQRYQYVWHVAATAGPFRRALDLGCGAGDAVWTLARGGVHCLGLDFAPRMIECARQFAQDQGLRNCQFEVGSVLDYPLPAGSFDLVFALGVIEYFSLEEVKQVLRRAREAMHPNGSLVVESRNRLFNLITFNDFTRSELEAGNIPALVGEALAIVGAPNMPDCVARLHEIAPPAALQAYPEVGVPVQVRHQYTPAQLVQMLGDCGFQTVALSGYHYHGMVPRLMRELPDMHASMARDIQPNIIERHQALTQCSSFMVHAKRC